MTKPRVFVTRPLARIFELAGAPAGLTQSLKALVSQTDCNFWSAREPPSVDELIARTSGCEGLLCMLTDRIDQAFLAARPSVRAVSSCSVGVDHIDLEAATKRRIPVGHTPGVLTETTADLAFALMLAASRRVVEGDRFLRAGDWTVEHRWEPDMLLGRDLHGATLGIIGLGAIGRAVARRAQGFAMHVLAWSRSGHSPPDSGIESVALFDLLQRSDFVSVHVALVPETHGLLDRRAISAMKPGAILINTARGGIVDEQALADALEHGSLAAAALDVFEQEPLPASHRLAQLPNVVLTPHIGSASIATRARMADLAAENLLAGLSGTRLRACANPEVEGTP